MSFRWATSPAQESIFHSLAAAPDGSIYIGTSFTTRGGSGERGKDVLRRYKDYAGGHIFRFEPARNSRAASGCRRPIPDRPLPFVKDLGVAVAGESIVWLISGTKPLYGMTFPGGHFFVFD